MASYLTKNGEPVSEVIPSTIYSLPLLRENCWHDCVVVTANRIQPSATDFFSLQIPGCTTMPFRLLSSKIGVEGWDNVGQVLF